MKNKLFISVIIILLSINTSKATNWFSSLEDAKKIALATDKLILVDFWAIWCGPCNKMDSESWSQDEVKVLMEGFVPVKIDIDSQKSLAQEYGVQGIPYVFILDSNGKIVYKQMSYKSKSEIIKLLKKYALSTQFLKQDLLNYHQQKSFLTSFRLASKYQDYSLYVTDKDVRSDISKLSSDYFSDSQNFLKKNDMDNKDVFMQKISLFEIQGYLINQNSRKALKMLDKIKTTSLHELNESFFNFLYYTAYSVAGDMENSKLWEGKLSEFDLKKSELFLKI